MEKYENDILGISDLIIDTEHAILHFVGEVAGDSTICIFPEIRIGDTLIIYSWGTLFVGFSVGFATGKIINYYLRGKSSNA